VLKVGQLVGQQGIFGDGCVALCANAHSFDLPLILDYHICGTEVSKCVIAHWISPLPLFLSPWLNTNWSPISLPPLSKIDAEYEHSRSCCSSANPIERIEMQNNGTNKLPVWKIGNCIVDFTARKLARRYKAIR